MHATQSEAHTTLERPAFFDILAAPGRSPDAFPDGTRIRWTYSELTADSCYWRGERLESDGKTWHLQVEFRARRVS